MFRVSVHKRTDCTVVIRGLCPLTLDINLLSAVTLVLKHKQIILMVIYKVHSCYKSYV